MKITLGIVGAAFFVFILQIIIPVATPLLALTPSLAFNGFIWQFVTYMFVHGDMSHIFFNMFTLVIFGAALEAVLGTRKYLSLFFLSGVCSAVFYLLLTFLFNPQGFLAEGLNTPLLGASGAVFGILTVYGILFPKNIILIFPGIPVPAFLAVIIFAAMEIFFGLSGLQPGIANWGHLGGIISGFLLISFWKHNLTKRQEKRLREEKSWQFIWE